MTPYKAAQIVNAALKENGIDKQIPPQMMYNYKKNNIIDFDAKQGEKKSFVDWLERYIEKQLALVS